MALPLHCRLESDAVPGGVARRFGRVPVEVDAHGSQLAPERAMLQRGQQRVELGKVGAVVGLELLDLDDASGEGALKVERRRDSFVSFIKPMLRPAMTAIRKSSPMPGLRGPIATGFSVAARRWPL
jgi:hypothetical protein